MKKSQTSARDDNSSRTTFKESFGWYTIATQYYRRYQKPIMHTETNQSAEANDPVEWLWKQWLCVERARNDGLLLLGFTWYGLVDFVDWQAGNTLQRKEGRVVPYGLYDLRHQPRPIAKTYHDLIERFQGHPILKDNPIFIVD